VLADSRKARLQRGGNDALVTLVTCYPFGSPDTGGPLRYVVVARPDTQPRMHDGVSGLQLHALRRASGDFRAALSRFPRKPAI
jgi:hypothetical protein